MNAYILMLRLMESGNSNRIRELKLTAKWSADSNEKIAKTKRFAKVKKQNKKKKRAK